MSLGDGMFDICTKCGIGFEWCKCFPGFESRDCDCGHPRCRHAFNDKTQPENAWCAELGCQCADYEVGRE